MWASMCQCSQHTIAVHLQTGPAEPGRPGQANPFLVAEIFITCWQLFNAWNKVKSWNAKPFESKGCSMGALCCGYLKTERRGKTCEQHNEVIYCLSLLLWSFHFSWPFLTFPDQPQPTSLRSSRGRSRRLPGYMAPTHFEPRRCKTWCDVMRFFSWKTLEDSSTLDKLGAT